MWNTSTQTVVKIYVCKQISKSSKVNCYPSDQQQIAVNLCPPNNLVNFFKVNSYPFRPDADRSESKSAAHQETPLSTGFDHLCGGEADKRERCGKKFTKKTKEGKKKSSQCASIEQSRKVGKINRRRIRSNIPGSEGIQTPRKWLQRGSLWRRWLPWRWRRRHHPHRPPFSPNNKGEK